MTAARAADSPDLSAIEAELQRMGANEELSRLVLSLLSSMATQNQNLQFRLDAALRQLWNRKSEKVSPDQLALFLAQLTTEPAATTPNESPAGQDSDAGNPPPDPTAPPAKTGSDKAPRKRGRQAFPADLPRRTEDILIPAAERGCACCGHERTPIGFELQTMWEFEPGSFYLLERRCEKLACKACEEEGVQTAPAPPKPIDGGRPGPGLLAQIVTAKENDSQPLYRQSKIYERHGIHLAPSTLGDWYAAAADLYEPIWKHLRADTLDTSYLLSMDDTGLPVLDRDDVRGITKGHIWTYLGDQGRVAFCEYTKTWEGAAPTEILKLFRGKVVQSDGYAGIDEFFRIPDTPKRAGCMDHCRRRFVKALQGGDARAALVVKYFADIYAIEAEARAQQLGFDALLALRQQKSRPMMERLQRVIADLHAVALPKSPIGKATRYAINQWPTLIVFLDDARVPLANAHVERQQRRIALGRKNYLFSGSHDGARRLAIVQTIVVNCDLLGISMWHYLRDIFQRLADGWPHSRLAELTPSAWAAAQKAQQAQAQ